MPAISGYPISPSELLMNFLKVEVDPDYVLAANIVVGPAGPEQISEGVVEIVDAGMPKQEPFGAVWVRAQIRCIGPSLEKVDTMGRHIWAVANWRNRVVSTMTLPDTTPQSYLIHSIKMVGGPSHHWDSQVTWESLQFAEMMVGLTPLVTA